MKEPTKREEEIIRICRQHLPRYRPVDARAGDPICGLLDILKLLGARLPFTLEES